MSRCCDIPGMLNQTLGFGMGYPKAMLIDTPKENIHVGYRPAEKLVKVSVTRSLGTLLKVEF